MDVRHTADARCVRLAGAGPAGSRARANRGVVPASGVAVSAERRSGLLTIDRVAIGYLAVSGALALAGGLKGLAIAAAHGLAIAAIYGLARRPMPASHLAVFLRLMYPIIATPLLYHEVALLSRFFHPDYFDGVVQGWEVAIFGSQVSQEASRWLPAFWLSEFLNLGYVAYYLIIPGLAIASQRFGGGVGLHRFAVSVALGFFVCYVWFILFPVVGPRYAFGPLEGALSDGRFNRIVRTILEGGSSKGTAFPSSHIAATCSAWIAAGREDRRVLWLMAVPVGALVLGTVYGGYHYAVDAAAGLAVTAAVMVAAPRLAAAASPV